MRGRVRPARPYAPIGVAVAVMGTWWLVAHNGGAGWVQDLGDILFGTLAIGIVGPALALGRSKIRVVAAPADCAAGSEVEVRIAASTRVRVRPVEPAGPEGFVGPARSRRSDEIIALLPEHRGVYEAVVVDVASAAPFGLQWWSRRMRLQLPEPLHVAPRRGEAVAIPPRPNPETGHDDQRVPAGIGEPRGVRPYRPGDIRRHVHWPATSHTARLMVREMEDAAAEPVRVDVDLPAHQGAAERVAERALGTVLRLLDGGEAVVLCTTEVHGAVVAAVADRRITGRRLARAVAKTGSVDQGGGITVSVETVSLRAGNRT